MQVSILCFVLTLSYCNHGMSGVYPHLTNKGQHRAVVVLPKYSADKTHFLAGSLTWWLLPKIWHSMHMCSILQSKQSGPCVSKKCSPKQSVMVMLPTLHFNRQDFLAEGNSNKVMHSHLNDLLFPIRSNRNSIMQLFFWIWNKYK